jgi:hypothetical protein
VAPQKYPNAEQINRKSCGIIKGETMPNIWNNKRQNRYDSKRFGNSKRETKLNIWSINGEPKLKVWNA